MLQASFLRRTKANLIPLEVGTRSLTTLTLVWPSVVNSVVILILDQVYMRLIFQGGLGCLLMPLLGKYYIGQALALTSPTPMHGGLSYPCKYYGRKFFYGNRPLTVDEFLYIVTNPHKLVNPLVFTSFPLGVQTVSWSSPSPRLIGDGRRSFSLSLSSGLETLLRQEKTYFLPTLVKQGIFVQKVCYFSLLILPLLLYLSNSIFFLFYSCNTTFLK